MRCRALFAATIVLAASLIPMHTAHAQEMAIYPYINRILEYVDSASPLLDELAAELAEADDNPRVADNAQWRIQVQRTAADFKALNAPMYEVVPPPYVSDIHLFFVAYLGFTDTALDLLVKFTRTRDATLLKRIATIRGHAGVAFGRFSDRIAYYLD